MNTKLLVPVKKAEIPEDLLRWVKRDTELGRIQSTWTEVVGWDSCKLVARKQGAVMRYAVSHYGYYACCRKAEVVTNGHPTEGTSYAELPMWALTIWIMAKSKAKNSIAEGYRLTQTSIELKRWERVAMNQFTVYFTESVTGTEWKVSLFRGDTRPFVRFWLVSERDDQDAWVPSVHGVAA